MQSPALAKMHFQSPGKLPSPALSAIASSLRSSDSRRAMVGTLSMLRWAGKLREILKKKLQLPILTLS